MGAARTLFEKVWASHVVRSGPGGHDLFYVDRHLVREGSFHAFEHLRETSRRVRRPDLTFATADHYVPTTDRRVARIGAGGGSGHVIEYAGTAIRALSMERRMTICNMSIEVGSRAGMIAPDETTYAHVEGRPYAPRGAAFRRRDPSRVPRGARPKARGEGER